MDPTVLDSTNLMNDKRDRSSIIQKQPTLLLCILATVPVYYKGRVPNTGEVLFTVRVREEYLISRITPYTPDCTPIQTWTNEELQDPWRRRAIQTK